MKKRLLINVTLALSLVSAFAHAEETENPLETKFYGFVLPKYNFSTAGLKTFATQTEVAPTSAASQLGSSNTNNSNSRGTWQIGQSRFGLSFKNGTSLSGKLEVDFFNNNDSEPSFALLAPRLRIAMINYKLSDGLTLMAGQFWDIFYGDVTPVTYNAIGNYYTAGNFGFIRQQFALKFGQDTGINLTFAIGMPAKNDNSAAITSSSTSSPAVTDSAGEFSAAPTLAVNLTYKDNDKELMGLSAIAGRVIPAGLTVGADSHTAYGFGVFTSRMFGDAKFKAKLYYGQDLNSLNALTLGNAGGTAAASTTFDMTEFGGLLNGWIPLSDKVGFLLGVGYATSPTTLLAQTATSSTLTSNLKVAGGFDYAFDKKLKTFIEYTYFSSTYTETAAAATTAYTAQLAEVGFKYEI